MTLRIQQFILGPIQNNSFLIIDEELKTCAVVDPPFGSEKILEFINNHNLSLKMILITHAHFDHIGGVNVLIPPPPDSIQLYMHPDDQVLWEMGGGASQFGFSIDQPGLQPTPVAHQQEIRFRWIQDHCFAYTRPYARPCDLLPSCRANRFLW